MFETHLPRRALGALAIVLGLGACAASADNVGADGSYGFDGEGWTRTTSGSTEDRWVGTGGLTLFVGGPAVVKPVGGSASAWAQTNYDAITSPPVPAPALFAPKVFTGKKTAVWFGWQFEGKNVYEYFFIDDGSKKPLHAELSGVGVSEATAAGVLGSLELL